MKIRRLTPKGIDLFRQFLSRAKEYPETPVPRDYLLHEETSATFKYPIDIEDQAITTRYEAGLLLHHLLGPVNDPQLDFDDGLWAWLSLFFFDQLCPVAGKTRKISDPSTLIPDSSNHQRYYRHLLAGPYFIFRTYQDNPEDAMVLLCQPVHTPGAVVEELASRLEIVTNRDFITMCTRLYYMRDFGCLKKGSGGKGAGSARRLAKNIREQLEVTWDLQSVGVDRLIELLPAEFSKFRN